MLQFFALVRNQNVVIIERFRKFHKLANPGLHFLIPGVDTPTYKFSLKDTLLNLEEQPAITKENVTVHIDGYIILQVKDPMKTAYNIEDYEQAIRQLTLTVLRSQIGNMTLDQLFSDRLSLNKIVYDEVNKASDQWGVECKRYEILQIEPPEKIKQSMSAQAVAEREKRQRIIQSEGIRQRNINISDGNKQAYILEAEGHAESKRLISENEAKGLELVANAIDKCQSQTIKYILTHDYLTQYKDILKKSDIVVTPEGKDKGNDFLSLASMLLLSNKQSGQIDSKQQHLDYNKDIQKIAQQTQQQAKQQQQSYEDDGSHLDEIINAARKNQFQINPQQYHKN